MCTFIYSALGQRELRERSEWLRRCLIYAAIPFVALAAASIVVRPVFSIRYVSPSIAFGTLVLSYGLNRTGERALRLATLGLAVLFLLLTPLYHDAAAVAGADALLAGGSGAPSSAAKALSSSNGFTDGSSTSWDSNNVSVTVNNPPASGSFTANSSAVEVIISQLQPTFFAGTLGFASMTVSARSVAISSSGPNCVYSLDPTLAGALTLTSGASISSSCGVLVNSSSSSALNINSGASISAPSIGVVGGVSSSSGASTPTPVTGIAGFPDPLSNVQPPSVGTCSSVTVPLGTSSLNPGYYCGLNINSGESVTLNGGTYSFNGNVNITSGASVTGTGVTLYFKSGTLALTSGASINFSAPTSGSHSGILVFEDRSNATQMNVNSGGSFTLTGALYLPHANMTISSGASISNVYSILVADSITVTSGASIHLNANYSGLANGSPIRTAMVVE